MIIVKKSNERGVTNLGWLESRHSFSFGDYYNPEAMGFASLRVINEDIVAPGAGFDLHPHSNMEIISYVVSGSLEHRDSLGNGRIIRAGEFQYMSAGRGVYHSEFNPSKEDPVHFLQIWVTPRKIGLTPTYADTQDLHLAQNSMTLIASSSPTSGVFTINQDCELSLGYFDAASQHVERLQDHQKAWIQVVSGTVSISGAVLSNGDAAIITAESELVMRFQEQTKFLLFQL